MVDTDRTRKNRRAGSQKSGFNWYKHIIDNFHQICAGGPRFDMIDEAIQLSLDTFYPAGSIK